MYNVNLTEEEIKKLTIVDIYNVLTDKQKWRLMRNIGKITGNTTVMFDSEENIAWWTKDQ